MKILSACLIRFFDLLLAFILLPFFLVFFVLLIIPQTIFFGKLFYVSQRAGKNNTFFTYIKLKSMYDTEKDNPPIGRAHLEAERIPPWGRFLRKTHLDEIPEILFIIIGTESFVGPRPLLPEHAMLVNTAERRILKPGWTGLSQIFLKRKGILPSRIQRRLDLQLNRRLNFGYYIKILFATLVSYISQPKPNHGPPGPTVLAYRQSVKERKNEEI